MPALCLHPRRSFPCLPMTRVHLPPHRADPRTPPNTAEHRHSLRQYTTLPVVFATPPSHSVPYVLLRAATYAMPNLLPACRSPLPPTCVPRSRIEGVCRHRHSPELRQLCATLAVSPDYHFDVDHVISANDVVCPVSPCCIHGSVS